MKHHFAASEADQFSRLTLLPQLADLDPEERASFEALIVKRFNPEVKTLKPWTVHEILRRLELDDLVDLSNELSNS